MAFPKVSRVQEQQRGFSKSIQSLTQSEGAAVAAAAFAGLPRCISLLYDHHRRLVLQTLIFGPFCARVCAVLNQKASPQFLLVA